MDWSSVYDDEGHEDGDWDREGDAQSSRAGMIAAFSLDGRYSPFICYAFTVNYILGVGCLGIPYAFLQSGILLGTALIIALSVVSYVTVMWVAVATQQEVSISIYHATTNPFIMSPYSSLAKRKKYVKHQIATTNERSSLISSNSAKAGTLGHYYASIATLMDSKPSEKTVTAIEKEMISSSSRHQKSSRDRDRRKSALSDDELIDGIKELEVTDLAHEFLGPVGKVSYQLALTALTFVGLLAYSQVFCDTFLRQVWPACPGGLPPLLFGAIVIPLSCLDLAEQVNTQVLMSLLRFLALGALLAGTAVALCVDYEHSALRRLLQEQQVVASASSEASLWTVLFSDASSIPMLRWSGFGVMFTTSIFSQLFQHSVPGLIRPLSNDDKKYVPSIFRYALITTATLYVTIGCLTVLYFGDGLAQSVNLNFVGFSWGLAPRAGVGFMLARMLALTVVLFPALDTLSVFPLIAITLGSNLHAAFPQWDLPAALLPVLPPRPSPEQRATRRKASRTWWRLVASVPPVVCSAFVSDLVVSLQVAGLCGVFVALIAPALLHRQTEHRIALIPASMQTSLLFSDPFNRSVFVPVVIGLGVVALIVSLLQMTAA